MVTLLKSMSCDPRKIECDIVTGTCDKVSDFSNWVKQKIHAADYVIIVSTPEICECFRSSNPIRMSTGEVDISLDYCQEKALFVFLNTSSSASQCPPPHYELGIQGLKQEVQLLLREVPQREIIMQYMKTHCNDTTVKNLKLLLEKLEK